MRAINLVPADSRPGRVNGGKSGGAVYGVLGVLVLVLLAASVFALAKKDEAQASQELATVEQSTVAYKQVATQYASFEAASKQAIQRIETVRSLADARFDWAGAMRDLSRLVPKTAVLSGLSASVDATAGQTSGGSSSQFRGLLPVPAIAITGCTMNQTTAANLIVQLQAMRRVTNVTLESSEKGKANTASETSFEQMECNFYDFTIVVFFAPGSAKSSADAAPSSSPSNTPVSTESAGGAAPTTPGSAPTTP